MKIYLLKKDKINLKEKEIFLKKISTRFRKYVLSNERRTSAYFFLSRILFKHYSYDLIDISFSENRRPFIVGNPFYFSISYSEEQIMIVISDKNVACDIESIKRVEKGIKKLLNLDNLSDLEFLIKFSQQEALIKLNFDALKNLKKKYNDKVFSIVDNNKIYTVAMK